MVICLLDVFIIAEPNGLHDIELSHFEKQSWLILNMIHTSRHKGDTLQIQVQMMYFHGITCVFHL